MGHRAPYPLSLLSLLALLVVTLLALPAAAPPGRAAAPADSAGRPLFLPLVLSSGQPARPRPDQSLDLNGTWQHAYSTGADVPPTDGWADVQVPSFVDWDPDRPHLWFRRSFHLPAGFSGEWAFLHFGGVKFAARVYLNGTLLGQHDDGFRPFELSVPLDLLQSENELLVQLDGWPSALAPELAGETASRADEVQDALLWPVGSQEWQVGIWQEVSLTSGRGVRLTDTFVRPSVRRRTLQIEVTLHNPTDRPLTVQMGNEVLGGDAPVLAFEPLAVELGAGEERTVRLEAAWPAPRLWSPDDPALYRLRTYLDNGAERLTRFGFRELWVEGNQVLLNGTPIHLRGTATHPFSFMADDIQSLDTARRYLQLAKDGNNIIMRLHAQPWPAVWYEAADEIGLLLVWESAYWCNSTSYRLEDPRFWANFREHLAGQLRRQRNHPSVVIWSLENELLLCSGREAGATPRMRTTEAELAGLVAFVKSIDPDRPAMFDGDADPGGQADILNLHYPHEYPRWSEWPNEAWWLEQTTATDIYPGRIDGWPLAKPLYIGEFAWVPPDQIEGPSIFFGDAVYRDPLTYYRRGKAAAWAPQIEAYRALGVQGFCPWNIWEGGDGVPNPTLYGLVQEKYAPQALFTRQKNARFFVTAPISRTAYLFNDRLGPADLTAEWELQSGGEVLGRQSKSFQLQPAEMATFELILPAPGADRLPDDPSGAPVTGTLAYRVKVADGGRPSPPSPLSRYAGEGENGVNDPLSYVVGEGCRAQRGGVRVTTTDRAPGECDGPADQVVFTTTEPVWLYHRQPLRTADRLDLYDPRGDTAATLAREGLPFRRISDLAALPADAAELVVGRDGLAAADDWQRLVTFAAAGGRVLVLQQDLYPPGVPLHLAAGGATIVFPRRPTHPALAGLTAEELRYWAPDQVVIRRPLAKPELGTYRVLIDSGSAAGLQHVGLIELPLGQGTLVAAQLDLVARLDQEPAARRLFQGLLDYLASFQPVEAARFSLVGSTPAVELALRALGFDVAALRATQPTAGLILAGADTTAAELPALLAEAARGATLWLHKPSPPLLAALTDAGLPVAEQPAVRGLVTLSPALRSAGLTDFSLFWAEGRADRAGVLPPLAHQFAATVFSSPADWTGATEILPAAFTVRSSAAYVGPDRVVLYSNGSIEADLEIDRAGDYVLGVQAEGTPVQGEYPLVRLSVDDETLAILAIGERQVYAAPASLAAGRHRLQLEFFNDRWQPPEDRNLTVERLLAAPSTAASVWKPLTQPAAMVASGHGAGHIVVDALNWDEPGAGVRKQELLAGLVAYWGVTLAPPAFAWTIEAEGMEVESGALVVPNESGVWLASNGTIAAPLPVPQTGRYAIRVVASGTPLGGVYPEFELALDGVVLGRQSVESASPGVYELAADLAAGQHRLSLSFVNDAYEPPEDRNLFVDRITVLRR